MIVNKMPFEVSDFHFEHKQWIRELEFWRDELKTFQRRLEDIVQRAQEKDAMAKVERFQNQFIRHNEVIDTFLHEINEHEHELTLLVKNEAHTIEDKFVGSHGRHRESIETQRKMYYDLKKEFFSFLITAK